MTWQEWLKANYNPNKPITVQLPRFDSAKARAQRAELMKLIKGENKMSAVVIAITTEVLDEMERWTFEEYKKFVPNGGNLNWLNNQLKARLELIEHMKHTFGGLK